MGKTAMISQPMRGKTEEEILAVRDKAKQRSHRKVYGNFL